MVIVDLVENIDNSDQQFQTVVSKNKKKHQKLQP